MSFVEFKPSMAKSPISDWRLPKRSGIVLNGTKPVNTRESWKLCLVTEDVTSAETVVCSPKIQAWDQNLMELLLFPMTL